MNYFTNKIVDSQQANIPTWQQDIANATAYSQEIRDEASQVHTMLDRGATQSDIFDAFPDVHKNDLVLNRLLHAPAGKIYSSRNFLADNYAGAKMVNDLKGKKELFGDWELIDKDQKSQTARAFLRMKGFNDNQIDYALQNDPYFKKHSIDDFCEYIVQSYDGQQEQFNLLAKMGRMSPEQQLQFAKEKGYNSVEELLKWEFPHEFFTTNLITKAFTKENPKIAKAALKITMIHSKDADLTDRFKDAFDTLEQLSPEDRVRCVQLAHQLKPHNAHGFLEAILDYTGDMIEDAQIGIYSYAIGSFFRSNSNQQAEKDWAHIAQLTTEALENKYVAMSGFKETLANAAASTIYAIPALAAQTVPGLGPIAIAGMFGAPTAGNFYREAVAEGADPKSAFIAGTFAGTVEAGLELISDKIFLKFAGISTKGGRAGMVSSRKQVINALTDKTKLNYKQIIANTLKRNAYVFSSEIAEEVLSQAFQDVAKNQLGLKTSEASEYLEIIKTTAISTAFLGAITHGTRKAIQKISKKSGPITPLGQELDIVKTIEEANRVKRTEKVLEIIGARLNQDNSATILPAFKNEVAESIVLGEKWKKLSNAKRQEIVKDKFFKNDKNASDEQIAEMTTVFNFINENYEAVLEAQKNSNSTEKANTKEADTEAAKVVEETSKQAENNAEEPKGDKPVEQSVPARKNNGYNRNITHLAAFAKMKSKLAGTAFDIEDSVLAFLGLEHNAQKADTQIVQTLNKMRELNPSVETAMQTLTDYVALAIGNYERQTTATPNALLVEATRGTFLKGANNAAVSSIETLRTPQQKAVEARSNGIENFVEQTNATTDNAKKVAESLYKLANKIGLNVNFKFEKLDKKINGRFDKQTNTIYINENSPIALETTIGHELTHFLKLSNQYDELLKLIKDPKSKITQWFLLNKGYANAEQMFRGYRELYSRFTQNNTLDEDYIWEEITADIAGALCGLNDGNVSFEIKNKAKNLWEKIKEFFKHLFNEYDNTKLQEQIARARSIWIAGARQTAELDQTISANEMLSNTVHTLAWKIKDGSFNGFEDIAFSPQVEKAVLDFQNATNKQLELGIGGYNHADFATEQMQVVADEIYNAIKERNKNKPKKQETPIEDKQLDLDLPQPPAHQLELDLNDNRRVADITLVQMESGQLELDLKFSLNSREQEFDFGTDWGREIDIIKQRAIANGTFMKAPNGEPSKLNERQWLLVRTNAFKNWFGDWENDPQNASKVIDENGEPKIVYHGTREFGFTVFDIQKSDDKKTIFTSYDEEVAGSYVGFGVGARGLTEKPNKASPEDVVDVIMDAYDSSVIDLGDVKSFFDGKENITEVFADFVNERGEEVFEDETDTVRLRSAIDEEEIFIKDHKKDREEIRDFLINHSVNYFETSSTDGVYALFMNLKNPLVISANGSNWSNIDTKQINGYDGDRHRLTTRGVCEFAEQKGYDGVIIKDLYDNGGRTGEITGDGETTIAISFKGKSQIKSATDNTGAFDGWNADIRYSLIGEVAAQRMQNNETELANLAVAKEMFEKFNSAKKIEENTQKYRDANSIIKMATGWERDWRDGKWKYEMPLEEIVDVEKFKKITTAHRKATKLKALESWGNYWKNKVIDGGNTIGLRDTFAAERFGLITKQEQESIEFTIKKAIDVSKKGRDIDDAKTDEEEAAIRAEHEANIKESDKLREEARAKFIELFNKNYKSRVESLSQSGKVKTWFYLGEILKPRFDEIAKAGEEITTFKTKMGEKTVAIQDIKEVPVLLSKPLKTKGGHHKVNHRTGEQEIKIAIYDDVEENLNTLEHELQHLFQARFGFSKYDGGAYPRNYPEIKGHQVQDYKNEEIEAFRTGARRDWDAETRRMIVFDNTELYRDNPQVLERVKKLKKYWDDLQKAAKAVPTEQQTAQTQAIANAKITDNGVEIEERSIVNAAGELNLDFGDELNLRYSLSHPAGREGYTLDKNGKIIYNNKSTEEIRNGYTNEFRRIQEFTDRGREKTRALRLGTRWLHRDYPLIEQRLLTGLNGLVSRLTASGQYGIDNGSVVSDKGSAWKIYKAVPATVFHDIFKVAHAYLKYADLVDVHTIEDYRNAACYLSDDGAAGFAIGADGDLISVFNLNSQKRGWVGAVRDMLIREGATHLDCYMSPLQPLHAIYANKFGAKTTSELAFNEDFVSKEFADHYERPSVAFMVLPPIANKPIEKKQFSKDDYDKAKAYQMSFVAPAQNTDTKFSLNGIYNPMEEIYDKARYDKFIKDKTNEELEALNTAATNYDSLLKIAQQSITLACWQVRNKRDNAPDWVIKRLTKHLNDAERAIAVERAQMTYEIIKNLYGEIPDPSAENAITAEEIKENYKRVAVAQAKIRYTRMQESFNEYYEKARVKFQRPDDKDVVKLSRAQKSTLDKHIDALTQLTAWNEDMKKAELEKARKLADKPIEPEDTNKEKNEDKDEEKQKEISPEEKKEIAEKVNANVDMLMVDLANFVAKATLSQDTRENFDTANLEKSYKQIADEDEKRAFFATYKAEVQRALGRFATRIQASKTSVISTVLHDIANETKSIAKIEKAFKKGMGIVVDKTILLDHRTAYKKLAKLLRKQKFAPGKKEKDRKMNAKFEKYLELCKWVFKGDKRIWNIDGEKVETTYDGAHKIIENLRAKIEHFSQSDTEIDYGNKQVVIDELQAKIDALAFLGGVAQMSALDVEACANTLEEQIKRAREQHRETIEQRRERIKEKYAPIIEGLKCAPFDNGKEKSILHNIAKGTESLSQRLESLVKFAKGKKYTELLGKVRTLSEDVSNATYDRESLSKERAIKIDEVLKRVLGNFNQQSAWFVKANEKRADLAKFGSDTQTELTLAEVMNIYAQVRQEHYAKPLENAKRNEQGELISEAHRLIEKRISQIPEMEKAIGEKGVALVNEFCLILQGQTEAVQKTYENITGRPFTMNETYNGAPAYFPIKRKTSTSSLGRAGIPLQVLPSRLSARIVNSVDIRTDLNFFEVANEAFMANEYFVAYSDVHQVWNQAFGDKEFVNALEAHAGKKDTSELKKHLFQIFSPKDLVSDSDELMGKLIHLSALTALGFNTLVMTKQLSSLPAPMFNISALEWGKAVISAFTPSGIRAMIEIINDNAWFYFRFNHGKRAALTKMLTSNSGYQNKKGMALFYYMITNAIGDALPTLIVGQGLLREAYKANLKAGMTEEMAKKRAHAFVADMMDKSQQANRTENINKYARSNDWAQSMLSQFKSTMIQYFSNDVRAYSDWSADKTDLARLQKLVKTVVLNHGILPSLYLILDTVFKAGVLGDDDEKKKIEDLFNGEVADEVIYEYLASNVAGAFVGIPVVGTALPMILNADTNNYTSGLPATETFRKTFYLFRKLAEDTVENISVGEYAEAAASTAKAAGQLIPVVRHVNEIKENYSD